MVSKSIESVCVVCGNPKIINKKRQLCGRCYQRLRSNGELEKPTEMVAETEKKHEHASEMLFVKNYFNHNQWIHQPATFLIEKNSVLYRPDFYDARRNVFIEVAGTRQAFHKNKDKYESFKETYPQINFEIRTVDGALLRAENGKYMWPSNNEVQQ